MQYWFLMRVTEIHELQMVLRQNSTVKGCKVSKYMCIPWKHSACRYCLLLQRSEHPSSPTVFLWEQRTSERWLGSWQKPSWPVHVNKGFWYSATACQAPCAQRGQQQNSSASAGRKSDSLPTIFSTNICHCLQVEAYLDLLWSVLRVLLICAHSAVSPMLLFTKELMKSTWRPRASCKTQGSKQLMFSDSSGS